MKPTYHKPAKPTVDPAVDILGSPASTPVEPRLHNPAHTSKAEPIQPPAEVVAPDGAIHRVGDLNWNHGGPTETWRRGDTERRLSRRRADDR